MSKPHRFGRLAGPLVFLACSAGAALAQSSSINTGTLTSGDTTLESGEYYDDYEIETEEGDEIIAVLTSYDFDPYLILIPPVGDQVDNDDFGGSGDVSLIEVPVDEPGTWKVRVTTYESGETGNYALMMGTRVADGDDVGEEEGPEEFTVKGTIDLDVPVEGTLGSDDPARAVDGSYYEAYALEAAPGTEVVITLESSEFDPYLVLVDPSGAIDQSNDDAEEGSFDSRIEATLAEGGRWLIVANTLEPEEVGSYRLTVAHKVLPQ